LAGRGAHRARAAAPAAWPPFVATVSRIIVVT